MFKGLVKAAAIAAMCLAAAGPLAAKTVNVATEGANAFLDATGKNAWYQNVSYSLNGQSRYASAGMFRLKLTTAQGNVKHFVGFCLEPLEYLRLPRAHTYGTSLAAAVVDRLAALVDNALGKVTDSKSAAAFQIAAWEIANEGGLSSLNLNGGAFRLGQAPSQTKALAQNWLDQIGTGSWKANGPVTILSAPRTQDLVTDLAPVPVPAAGLLLIGAVGALGLMRRRTT